MKNSAYEKAIAFLELEIHTMFKEGYLTEEAFYESIEGLHELSASEVMVMYKAWKDSD